MNKDGIKSFGDKIKKKRQIIPALAIFLCFGCIQIALYKIMKVEDFMYYFDSKSYTEPFLNFIKNGFFSSDNINPEYVRTIGYPIFWYIFNSLGGDIAVIIAQNFIFLVTEILLWKFGSELLGVTNLTIILIVFRLLDMNMFYHNCAILSDGFFASIVFLAAMTWVAYLKGGKSTKEMVVFSLLLNYALAVRPILYYFNILLIIALVILALMKAMNWKHVLIYFLAFMLLCGSWIGRNYIQTGHAVYCPIGNRDMLVWYAYMTYQKEMNDSGEVPASREEFVEVEVAKDYSIEELNDMDEIELYDAYGKVGRRYISEHRIEYMKVLLNHSKYVLLGIDGYVWENAGFSDGLIKVLELISRIMLVALYFTYLYSIIRNIKKIDLSDVSLFIFLLYLFLASVNIGAIRFRVPMVGIICIGILWLWRNEEQYHSLYERIKCHKVID